MPKVKAPKTENPKTESPSTESPKVDMAPLIANITNGLNKINEGESLKNEGAFDTVVEIRAFIEENGGYESDTLERQDVRNAVISAVAESSGLKVIHVEKKIDKDAKVAAYGGLTAAELKQRSASAVVLVSTLLSMAWPKEEAQQKKVAKLLEGGETRFTVLRGASRKPSTRVQPDPNANKITKANFAEKLQNFLTKAFADLGGGDAKEWEVVFDLADDSLEAVKTAMRNPEAA